MTTAVAEQQEQGETMKLVQTGLIPIYERENQDTAVDARELHEFLEVGKDFSNWIKDRIGQCDLSENEDYAVFAKTGVNLHGGRPSKEYALTLDAAKHIAMIERNDKGKQARQYFIDYEKKHRVQPLALSGDFGALLIQAGQQIQEQNLVITTLTEQTKRLESVNTKLATDNITLSVLASADQVTWALTEGAKHMFQGSPGPNIVLRAMREIGWIYKRGTNSPNLAKSDLEAKGYFRMIFPKVGEISYEQTEFTKEGLIWAYPKLCKHFGREVDPLVQQYLSRLDSPNPAA